jgi:hypothetical protein
MFIIVNLEITEKREGSQSLYLQSQSFLTLSCFPRHWGSGISVNMVGT